MSLVDLIRTAPAGQLASTARELPDEDLASLLRELPGWRLLQIVAQSERSAAREAEPTVGARELLATREYIRERGAVAASTLPLEHREATQMLVAGGGLAVDGVGPTMVVAADACLLPKARKAAASASKDQAKPRRQGLPMLEPKAGERRHECVEYKGCLSRFCVAHPAAKYARCPSGCASFVEVSREERLAEAQASTSGAVVVDWSGKGNQ